MSRLDDAIAALRIAAGDRAFVLVIDRRSIQSTEQAIDVVTTPNMPTYCCRGLLMEGRTILDAKFPVVISDDDDTDPDSP